MSLLSGYRIRLSAKVPYLDPLPSRLKLKLTLNKGPQELVGSLDSSRRPFDGELAGITLWPETEKIFGHGYEVVSYTSSLVSEV